MPHYFIAQLNVHDPGEYARYLEGTDALLQEFSGTVRAVDEAPEVLEGEWPYRRTVLIEFPTRDHLDAWYHSEGYQAIALHRRAAATGNVVSIRGRD